MDASRKQVILTVVCTLEVTLEVILKRRRAVENIPSMASFPVLEQMC